MQLPVDLLGALESEVLSHRDVTDAARRLSLRYREGHGRETDFLHGDEDVTAYAVARLPATFAALAAALKQVRESLPDLAPGTMLELGAGPGTAVWAAVEAFPGLERIECIERSAGMIRMGQDLASHAESAAIRRAVWHEADLAGPWNVGMADIVIAAYCIGELPSEARERVVRCTWEHTESVCLIVEPGTPRGYQMVRQAGDVLGRAGANIVAPFPLAWDCLASQTDWCHFSARVPRTRGLRAVKGGRLSYEDEKFSYVVASRRPGLAIAARVVRHPQVRKGHIRLTLCSPQGIREIVVTRSDREAYRRAKDLVWGSAIMPDDAPLYGLPSWPDTARS